MIDLTAITETGLNANTAVELRKAAADLGIKGASKGRKADLIAQIMVLVDAAKAEQEQDMLDIDGEPMAYETETEGEKDMSPEAKKARRSRRGMVIVAKGTEVHKSDTFRQAAEALGWSVEIEYTEMDEVDEDDEPLIRHHAVATKNGAVVEGSWIGKAWDYANAGAGIGGKARKVRNLKEALRILAAN